ncbi:hypothetical protein [Pseudomonas sp. URMO17WK12:I2]|uniref:hypothetical protein n=1 Tax=Pseudomonas sp. URMO17WK12:I2 TaxID=1261623 RepID=UPI000DB865D4|nr:hypothetical protein [Pseudomonas sp. URMO17WK12:I2]PZW46401.1 hypothetical protein F469_02284 [Pseudomonas sp. URMO17WK12:I2]
MSSSKSTSWCWWCGTKTHDGKHKPKWSVDTKALLSKIGLILLTYASLFVSLFPLIDFKNMGPKTIFFFGAFSVSLIVLLGFLICYEISTSSGKRVYSLSDTQGIKSYMLHWIENGGRIAIWSRDLSWVDDEAKDLLMRKARKGELILCLPQEIDLSKELKAGKAEVHYYGLTYKEDTNARFTIAFYGRDGSKVAVGRTKADKHVVEEFGSGDHPAFYLAHDLVKFAKAISTRDHNEPIQTDT